MGWIGTGLSEIGRVRQLNQDAFAIDNERGLWVVADGMGGHVGGEIASRLAVDAVVAYAADHRARLNAVRTIRERESLFVEAVETANRRIRSYAEAHPEYRGMGTTIVVLHIAEADESATVVHAGDSRAYRIHDAHLIALTRDHSLVEEHIALGLLTPREAERHPLRHILTKAVGIEPRVNPDARTVTLSPADRVLLCTDGLTKMISDAQILDILQSTDQDRETSAENLCHALVAEANRRGGEDNITVVLVERRNASEARQAGGEPRRNSADIPK